MSFFSDIFSSSVGEVVGKVGEAVDRLVTSDEEKLKLANELKQIEIGAMLKKEEIDLQYEQELTERLQADMTSDSWLSKNIRPLTLIFILVMYSLLSISSGFKFEVTESYVQLLGQWGMLIMSFYFGGRTLEKMTTVVKGK
jgi:hypothetical protein